MMALVVVATERRIMRREGVEGGRGMRIRLPAPMIGTAVATPRLRSGAVTVMIVISDTTLRRGVAVQTTAIRL
jgi:hypothetical protein